MKNDKIIYDVKIIKQIFNEDFRKPENHSQRFSGIVSIEEFIQFAEGTNNWCSEDLEHFEQQLLESNHRFQEFRDFLFANGYRGFSETEIGTLWVIKCAMIDELVSMGLADMNRSASTNSFAQMILEYEKNQKKKAGGMGVLFDTGIAGRKRNVYNYSYMMWIQRLLPWLREHESIVNKKEALIFIGFLLEASGHYEFRQQYGRDSRVTKKVQKVKGKSRWREFETKIEYVLVPYREYLHGRMKTIMNRLKTMRVLTASA